MNLKKTVCGDFLFPLYLFPSRHISFSSFLPFSGFGWKLIRGRWPETSLLSNRDVKHSRNFAWDLGLSCDWLTAFGESKSGTSEDPDRSFPSDPLRFSKVRRKEAWNSLANVFLIFFSFCEKVQFRRVKNKTTQFRFSYIKNKWAVLWVCAHAVSANSIESSQIYALIVCQVCQTPLYRSESRLRQEFPTYRVKHSIHGMNEMGTLDTPSIWSPITIPSNNDA